ncbi:MAG: hypothetical protein A2V70_08985 [Planctomycetes bacterium RBG_13_63_9]|nr:MAG: hypothetical protein A2V70_08985 [Planctomycetes bacterium RBG_13_63_9]
MTARLVPQLGCRSDQGEAAGGMGGLSALVSGPRSWTRLPPRIAEGKGGQAAHATRITCLIAVILACCLPTPIPTRADDTVDVEMIEQEAFRAAVDRVAPSVVRIETVGGLERVGDVLFENGPTTGLVVDSEGYIVSSAFNFINRPTSILVRLPDAALKPAQLVATDHNRMLVLLKIDTEGPLAVPEFAPGAEMRVGQWVIAVGRTFEGDRPNMAVGILSALGRIWGKAVQTDAAVSPNNYGGPLVDVHGRVIGVLVPLSPGSTEEIAGYQWYDSGIGFAIDGEHVMRILPRLKRGEDLYPGLIGISLQGKNPSLGEPVIVACRPNSPAGAAGLMPGDRIVEIEGREMVRAAEVKRELSRRYAGDRVQLVVLRDQKRMAFDVELVAKLKAYRHPFVGILPMRTTDDQPGVAVRYVYPDSPAAAAGVEPGDRLVALSGRPIRDRDELLAQIGRFQPDEEVELEFRRGDQPRSLKLKLAALPESLPPAELPAARVDVESGSDEPGGDDPDSDARPQVGTVWLKIPELKNDAWAYVPQRYDAAVPHGVLVWLHDGGGFDWEELVGQWKPHCDHYDLILVAPKAAEPDRWRPTEVTLVERLLDEISSRYTVDPTRVVLHGHQGGGALACLVAARHRELVRAVALVDAPVTGQPPENDSLDRLAVYLTTAKQSRRRDAIERSVDRLRGAKVPVTVKDLGETPRLLTAEEQAELARWIDMLDRI